MNRHTVIVIIVTAVVTATVKIVVEWILNFFKLQITTTLIAKAKTTLGKRILKFAACILMLAITSWGLIHRVNAPGSPTRYDVLWTIIDFMGVGTWIVAIIGMTAGISVEKRLNQMEKHLDQISKT